jgi:hypothetical protein
MADIKFALIFLALAIGMASATQSNHVVISGYITDITTGNPVEGANVLGLCLNNSNSFNVSSNVQGKYNHVLVCPIGGTVQVTATKGNSTGTNSTIVTPNGHANDLELDTTVNNHDIVNVQIPEFPTAAAPVILSMLSFGMLRLRKR